MENICVQLGFTRTKTVRESAFANSPCLKIDLALAKMSPPTAPGCQSFLVSCVSISSISISVYRVIFPPLFMQLKLSLEEGAPRQFCSLTFINTIYVSRSLTVFSLSFFTYFCAVYFVLVSLFCFWTLLRGQIFLCLL